jgi:hypothetical protein
MFVPLLLGNSYVLYDPQHVNCPTAETRIITCVDERYSIFNMLNINYNLSMLSPRKGGSGICGAFDYQLHTHPGDFD